MHKSEREKMHVHGERNLRARERERERVEQKMWQQFTSTAIIELKFY